MEDLCEVRWSKFSDVTLFVIAPRLHMKISLLCVHTLQPSSCLSVCVRFRIFKFIFISLHTATAVDGCEQQQQKILSRVAPYQFQFETIYSALFNEMLILVWHKFRYGAPLQCANSIWKEISDDVCVLEGFFWVN